MSSTTLNWELREGMCHMRESGRLFVWLSYVLHANKRNRAWPSVDALMKETGYSRAIVVRAKQWLVDHQALEDVSYELRIDDERRHPRLDVKQITGVLVVNNRTYQTLYTNPEEINSSASKLLIVQPVNSITSKPEGIKESFKGIQGFPAAPDEPFVETLYSVILKGAFGIDYQPGMASNGHINAILKELRKQVDPLPDVEEMKQYYADWAAQYPDLTPIQSKDKLPLDFLAWRGGRENTPEDTPLHDPWRKVIR